MAFPRRVKRWYGSLRSERRTLRQGLVALVLSTTASLVAGLTLSGFGQTLEDLPGLLILIPAAVGMRGTIFGAIGARLGTATHAGSFEVSLRRGGVLMRNAEVGLLTTITSSVWLAILAKLVATVLGQPAIPIWQLVTISVVGGILGSVVILLATVGLSVLSYRRSWDLDAVGTPMVTALGDAATLPTLYLATLLTSNAIVNAVAATLCVAACIGAILRLALGSDPAVRRVAAQMTGVILLTPLLDVAAGALLNGHERSLLANPGLLVLIPPFVSQAGALGGILASRLSSKLQIGTITGGWRLEAPALADGAIVTAFALSGFLLVALGGTAIAESVGRAHPGPGVMIGGTMLAGLLLVPAILALGYAVAIATSRMRLDPDDQSVPIITSTMDLAGVAALLFTMWLLGGLAIAA